MGGGELLPIPSFLLFGGHGVDDLVEVFVGHCDAGRIKSSSDFLDKSLDRIGASAHAPHGLGHVEELGEVIEFVTGLGHELAGC